MLGLRHPQSNGQVVTLAGYFTIDDPDGIFGNDPAVESAYNPSIATSSRLRPECAGCSSRPRGDLDLTAHASESYAALLRQHGATVDLRRTPGAHDVEWADAQLPAVAMSGCRLEVRLKSCFRSATTADDQPDEYAHERLRSTARGTAVREPLANQPHFHRTGVLRREHDQQNERQETNDQPGVYATFRLPRRYAPAGLRTARIRGTGSGLTCIRIGHADLLLGCPTSTKLSV